MLDFHPLRAYFDSKARAGVQGASRNSILWRSNGNPERTYNDHAEFG
jgi:hypothetical protein